MFPAAAGALTARPERALGRPGPGPGPERYKRYSTGGLYTGPFFDPTSPNNITTQLGTHAYLPCKVKQLGNKSVRSCNTLCSFMCANLKLVVILFYFDH